MKNRKQLIVISCKFGHYKIKFLLSRIVLIKITQYKIFFMRKLYKILLLFFFVNFSCVLNATIIEANLLVPTASISGNATVCQDAAQPQITFTGSGGTAPYTFTYNINGGVPQTITTTGTNDTVTVLVTTSASGIFTYNLVSFHDATLPVTEITPMGNAVITVKPQPDASLGGTGSGTSFNGIPAFRVCSNTISSFIFTNISSTPSTLITNYTIDWGDGSPNFSSTSWNTTTHTYGVGYWNLVYKIQSTNGCEITKNYVVFVGSNPAVSLGNPGNTDICNSTQLTFPISGTENNPPGTTYTVSFNDGSSSIIYNHPPPSTISHTFLKTSCGVNSSDGTNSYPNSFRANIVAQNPCGTSAVGVVPIYVSAPPIADFTMPINGCTNASICINNTTTGGFENNGNSNSCNTNPKFVWEISPSSYTVVSGSIGNDFGSTDPNLWLSGSSPLCLRFSQAGTYTITIKTANRCGTVKTKTQQICIETPLVPTFDLDNRVGCSPQTITAKNITVDDNSCKPPTYLWKVSYTSTYCGARTVTIPNQTTKDALYNFTEPGTYNITLSSTNSCGTVTSPIQTVTVKKPPTITSINGIQANYCGATTLNPTATVNSCTPDSSSLTYAWSFPGGSPATANTANPGTINYSTAGNYTVSLVVSNECGDSVLFNQTFSVNKTPTITNIDLSQTICSGTLSAAINLTSDDALTTFSWNATATAGISGFVTSGTNNTIPARVISTTNPTAGTITYSVTPRKGTCVGTPVNFVINVNPAPRITTQRFQYHLPRRKSNYFIFYIKWSYRNTYISMVF